MLVVTFHLRRPMAFLSLSLYDTPGRAPRMNVFFLRARRLSSKLLKQGYLVERLKSSLGKFYGRYRDHIQQYEVSLSRMLNDILTLTSYSDFPIDFAFHDLVTGLDLHRITSSFHGAFVTDLASQWGTLTLPDTWFRPPFWGLAYAPIVETSFTELAISFLDFSP